MIETQKEPQRAWFLVTGLLFFLITSGFSVLFEIQESGLASQINELAEKRASLMKPAAEEKTEASTNVASALFVRTELQKIQIKQLPWSKIIEKIENSIPKDGETKEPVVELRSYTGNEEGNISVSAITRSGAKDPFADVAAFLRALGADPSFHKIFIPSVAKSITPEGDMVLTFSATFAYNQPTF